MRKSTLLVIPALAALVLALFLARKILAPRSIPGTTATAREDNPLRRESLASEPTNSAREPAQEPDKVALLLALRRSFAKEIPSAGVMCDLLVDFRSRTSVEKSERADSIAFLASVAADASRERADRGLALLMLGVLRDDLAQAALRTFLSSVGESWSEIDQMLALTALYAHSFDSLPASADEWMVVVTSELAGGLAQKRRSLRADLRRANASDFVQPIGNQAISSLVANMLQKEELRWTGAQMLALLKPTGELLALERQFSLLPSIPSYVRRALGMAVLSALNEERQQDAELLLHKSADADVIKRAAEVLGRAKQEQVLDVISRRAFDTGAAPLVRTACVVALGGLKCEAACGTLEALTKDPDASVQRAAMREVATAVSEERLVALATAALANGPSESAARDLLTTLWNQCGGKGQHVVRLLAEKHSDPTVRSVAARLSSR